MDNKKTNLIQKLISISTMVMIKKITNPSIACQKSCRANEQKKLQQAAPP